MPRKTATTKRAGAGAAAAKKTARPRKQKVIAAPAEQTAWQIAVLAAESKKAENVRVLNLQGLTSFTDYLVLCSGTNPRQVQAIADEVELQLKNEGERPKSVEGYKNAEWILLDYGDYVVNVFSEKARQYYDLDRLWQDAAEVVRSAAGGE
ncbi:MAG: ribosome silencing factor [Bryobacterales bacterium]|nr:ribosome silencing factor [Bryobacterales bacterium]